MTVVEVMVSFALLLLAMGMLTRVVTLAENSNRRFWKDREILQTLSQAYYFKTGEAIIEEEQTILDFKGDESDGFSIPVVIRSYTLENNTLHQVCSP